MCLTLIIDSTNRACYEDGKLVPAKTGQTVEPKPCAGNDGTIITVEDLFYNTPTRLSALRSSTEEYARILDVMTKYAVHNHKVAFVCKKVGHYLYGVQPAVNDAIHFPSGGIRNSRSVFIPHIFHIASNQPLIRHQHWKGAVTSDLWSGPHHDVHEQGCRVVEGRGRVHERKLPSQEIRFFTLYQS